MENAARFVENADCDVMPRTSIGRRATIIQAPLLHAAAATRTRSSKRRRDAQAVTAALRAKLQETG